MYFFLGITLYLLPKFCRQQTDGFSLARITSVLPPTLHWQNPPLDIKDEEELSRALDQPYAYLGCGGQCFAFASQDGSYVIKFFKTRFHPPYHYLLTERKRAKAIIKLARDFNSYCFAYDNLKQETGLLYLHLEKSQHLQKKLHIADKLGIAHVIDLDHFEFAVQRRAELVFAHFDRLMQTDNLEGMKESLRSLIEITVARCRKGYFDEDAKIHRNFGFIQNQAVFIDIGRFVKDPSRMDVTVYQQDLMAITNQLRNYTATHYPNLTPYFDEAIQDILKS